VETSTQLSKEGLESRQYVTRVEALQAATERMMYEALRVKPKL
jgi:hypothetical protein